VDCCNFNCVSGSTLQLAEQALGIAGLCLTTPRRVVSITGPDSQRLEGRYMRNMGWWLGGVEGVSISLSGARRLQSRAIN